MKSDVKSKGRSSKKRLAAIAAALAAFFLVIAPAAAAPVIFEGIFGGRIEADPAESFCVEDFDNLTCERYEFLSDRGNTLVGYLYHNETVPGEEVTGTVVVVHGFGGGGQRTLMDVSAEFAAEGFDVFAYDATGNDESSGDGIISMPHGVKDLDAAITLVENELGEDTVFLWGHSWGGYCASAVLTLHPEVRAVCEVSGMNTPLSLMRSLAGKYAGPVSDIGLPYLAAYQQLRSKGGAGVSAIEGFESSDAAVIVVQSMDDEVVLPSIGYDKFYEKYAGDTRFTFITYADRGHDRVFRGDAQRGSVDEELFGEIIKIYKAAALN